MRSASFSLLLLQLSIYDSRRVAFFYSWLADTNDSGILTLLARLLRASERVSVFLLRSALIGRVNKSKVESPSRSAA